jgi:hypothetical protein
MERVENDCLLDLTGSDYEGLLHNRTIRIANLTLQRSKFEYQVLVLDSAEQET